MRADLITGWLEKAGIDLSPPTGLPQLSVWTQACRTLALERIPGFPVWVGNKRPVGGGDIIPAHIERYDPPADRIWPDMWRWAPVGPTLYVLRVPPDEFSKGGIEIPNTARQLNHRGWVLNVSPDISAAFDPTVPVENPLDLVGRQMAWGQYAGRSLAETAIEDRWAGEYVQLAWNEMLGIYVAEEEEGNGS